MTRWVYLARFFFVAPPMPLLMIGAFAVATILAISIVVIDPPRAAGAMTPILLLQLFACSSGFDVPARRGHYDLLLTHGQSRWRIIVGHWLASITPGLLCWLLLAAVCYVAAGEDRTQLVSAGTVSAVILVSTIPWAVTVRLPRFSGAIGWLLVVATLSLVRPDIVVIDTVAAPVGWSVDSATDWLTTASAVLVYPLLLVGRDLRGRELLFVVPGLIFALAALSIAFWSVNRRDVPLEAAQ